MNALLHGSLYPDRLTANDRHDKTNYIGRNVKRLNDILSTFIVGIAPAADLNIYLAVILICSLVIPCKHPQNDCGFKARGVAHSEAVRSVSQTACEDHLCAGPSAGV